MNYENHGDYWKNHNPVDEIERFLGVTERNSLKDSFALTKRQIASRPGPISRSLTNSRRLGSFFQALFGS